MDRKQNIVWEDVLNLRVVQRLGQIINRRWNLGLGFFLADGSLFEGEEADQFDTSRQVCELFRSSEIGENCTRSNQGIAAWVKKNSPELFKTRQSTIITCHAGLQEVVAPIILGGELQALIIVGGYLKEGQEDVRVIFDQLNNLGVSADGLDQAVGQTSRLSHNDEEYLRDLVELVAEEITTFQTESVFMDRRQPLVVESKPNRYSYDEIIGQSAVMKELYHLLDKVIGTDSTVLIQGENGTGKELIAKAIHFNSHRKERRFVVQNCSAFNDNLLDSELFGHKKGAFTGAVSDKQGLFEIADGSTFFLDEIGDMSPSLQVKLLRVLQDGTFISVGDTQTKHVNVRIIAATNRDLKRMVERGEFREDLYYRINVINITIPPLRDRKDDIYLLINHFLRKHSQGELLNLKKLTKSCVSQLIAYNWPGNIRELENEIERMIVLADEEKVISDNLLSSRIRQRIQPSSKREIHGPYCLPEAVKNLERNMIYEVLKRNHWNKTRAALELQISRRNLIRKVNKYNLDQRKES